MELIVHDEPAATGHVRATLDEVADKYDLPADQRFDLKLAATEALTNALRSGSGKPVRVQIVPGPDAIEVEILGQGAFDPSRRGAEGGRGIPLMLALADDVQFSSSALGTRVRVRKRVTRAGEGGSPL